jgi:hypothetical protein
VKFCLRESQWESCCRRECCRRTNMHLSPGILTVSSADTTPQRMAITEMMKEGRDNPLTTIRGPASVYGLGPFPFLDLRSSSLSGTKAAVRPWAPMQAGPALQDRKPLPPSPPKKPKSRSMVVESFFSTDWSFRWRLAKVAKQLPKNADAT